MKTNKLLVICSAMSLICLAACEGNNVSSSSSAQHEHAYEAVVTAPTHTAAGHTTYTCECGDTYTADEVAALGHTYEAVVTAPTCTAAGYTTYTCVCGDTYTADEVAAKGHSHQAVVTAPTHTSAGYTTYTCECGDTYTADEVAALGHKFIDGSCSCGEEFVAPKGGWALTTEIKDGDNVLIGAPAYGKLLSAEKVSAGSYYNKGVDYSASDFTNVTDAEIFVVTANADGSYTFTSKTGVVIALAASYSSLNDTGIHKSWTLTEKSEGIFYLKNTGRGNYLEWYASKDNWSTYATSSLSDLFEISFYGEAEAEGAEHIHNYISEEHKTTCTEDGYTSFTCRCGDTYTEAGTKAEGHKYTSVVTAPTCTTAGYTTYTCSCGDTYTADEVAALGHKYVDGICSCGEEDPTIHKHAYGTVVTAPTCTAAGYTTYTCSCGDTYKADEVAALGHIDENLDIDCDREGCTSKVAPKADSTLSTFTANCLGSKVSVSSQYYVEGTIVEVMDAKNGIFYLDDGTGEKFYFRLPVNADGVSHANWKVKLVLGDKVKVYGKINKFSSSSAPNGQYYPAIQGGVVTLLEQHDHVFGEPTCVEPGYCTCGQDGPVALGHSDGDGNDLCDRCGFDVTLTVENVTVRTDNNSGVVDTANGTYTWSETNIDVIVAKGTSSQLYTTSKDHMRIYKGNTLTISNKTGITVKSVIISVTNETQLTNLEKLLTGYTYTKDVEELTITIDYNSADNLVISNTGSTLQVKQVSITYKTAQN